MRGYDFHPDAEVDLDAIWEFIAQDNDLAADRTPLREMTNAQMSIS
jgi:plasmid stabilization system protein ParE